MTTATFQKSIRLEPINITAPAFKANPFPIFKQWRNQTPIVPVKVMGQRAWIITRYNDVLDALKDERLLKNKHTARADKKQTEPWMPSFLKPLEQNMLDLDTPELKRLGASSLHAQTDYANAAAHP
jgi:cytochrome P450 PksS